MQMKSNKKLKTLFLAMAFIMAATPFAAGCNGDKGKENQVAPTQTVETSEKASETVLGEGKTEVPFTVVDKEGNETVFEIHTDKETVCEALLELDLIAGEDAEYGLYVKTVNGITADYDKDGTYWAFYINGEYGMTGVDVTEIVENDTYALKAEE